MTRLRALGAASALLLAVGCSSAPPPAPLEPIRCAVIAAPLLGAPEASYALYEVVDVLSADPDIELVLVVGPLFGAGKQSVELARDELIGALGALAGSVHVALGPLDLERDPGLLEALERALPARSAELAYSARVSGVRLDVLGPAGEVPADEADAGEGPDRGRELLLGGPPDYPSATLRVTHGPALQLEGSSLQVPALGSGQAVYALLTLNPERGTFSARLRVGDQDEGEEVRGPWN